MNEVKDDVILNNQLFDWLCKIMQEENSIDSVYWVRENARDGINEEMLMRLMNLYEFVVISLFVKKEYEMEQKRKLEKIKKLWKKPLNLE